MVERVAKLVRKQVKKEVTTSEASSPKGTNQLLIDTMIAPLRCAITEFL